MAETRWPTLAAELWRLGRPATSFLWDAEANKGIVYVRVVGAPGLSLLRSEAEDDADRAVRAGLNLADGIGAVGAKTAYIAPGSPWENGFIESFNARLRDELLDGEIIYSLVEAKIVIESWRRHYNTVRPHGSLGYKPPAPEVFVPAIAARAAAQPRPAPPPALAQSTFLN